MERYLSSTVEQYIKSIYQESQYSNDKLVTMGAIASTMSVAPGTATAMVIHLQKEELLSYTPRVGVRLTNVGNLLALKILRRHRLIEVFLDSILHYDQSEVHRDAERLEHVVSDLFIDKIEALMGYPTSDPHGSPIPRKDGTIDEQRYISLDNTTPNERYTVIRLLTKNTEFLNELQMAHINVGTTMRIKENNRSFSVITAHCGDEQREISLGYASAARIYVKKAAGGATP